MSVRVLTGDCLDVMPMLALGAGGADAPNQPQVHRLSRDASRRPRRKARTPSEFARIYGSRKRVAWVKAQPCVVPFCVGDRIDGHHIRSDGTSRKADACWIVPLCFSHHREVHGSGVQSFARKYGLDLDYCARLIDSRWTLENT